MRCWSRFLPIVAMVAAVTLAGSAQREARAQAVVGGPYVGSYRVSDYLGAPGLYGMS